jgi:hypothetical protein
MLAMSNYVMLYVTASRICDAVRTFPERGAPGFAFSGEESAA